MSAAASVTPRETHRGKRAVLISTYDLGHQPFSLASAAAWLEATGNSVALLDLSVQKLDMAMVADADLLGFYLPMHTATRLTVPLIRRLRSLLPGAHFCAFGLYAPLNADLLRSLGVESIIGGEFEQPLANLLASSAATRPQSETGEIVSLAKQRFRRPVREGLAPLSHYAHLLMPDGSRRQVGFTEATRGCKHHCRHCPIVPVYEGRFFIVQRDVVLEDIRQLVAAGAEHISFGDPDFFNGSGHALALVHALHEEHPHLTYDVTIKIEHIVRHADALSALAETGCMFITSAVESVDNRTLGFLLKQHTQADFVHAVALCREANLVLSPTFVPFTPWLTLEGYRDLLRVIAGLDLIEHVAPVQLAIRLLIPAGSRLLDLPDIRALVGLFDPEALCYPWVHPDPRVDALYQQVNKIVQGSAAAQLTRGEVFAKIQACADAALGRAPRVTPVRRGPAIPYMSEPWYCCAEPTTQQLSAY
jgi:radical SAM superfamily enzyme YgiQ (UPF0313 family)